MIYRVSWQMNGKPFWLTYRVGHTAKRFANALLLAGASNINIEECFI